jgi:hypothetical protein
MHFNIESAQKEKKKKKKKKKVYELSKVPANAKIYPKIEHHEGESSYFNLCNM